MMSTQEDSSKSIDYSAIIKESKRRSDDYYRVADQIYGDELSEVIERRPITISGSKYWLPVDMFEIPIIKKLEKKSVRELIRDLGEEPTRENIKSIIDEVMALRLKYDFEFCSATCFKIQDKATKADINLILNKGQRIYLKELERMRMMHIPIRIILLKARQWGGSTLTELYMLWLQIFHYPSWHSAIISKVNSQSANIRAMISKAVKFFPMQIQSLTLSRFEGMNETKYIPERGCRITIASAEKPENLRSFDFAMLHMSEVATWPDTPTKSGDDLAQSLNSTVPDEEGTMIVMESTAKGVGGYFHDEWIHATSGEDTGEGKKVPVFVPWFMIPLYKRKIPNMRKFIDSMSEYNWWQWRQGASLEGIYWYNCYKTAKRMNDFQMRSEYPTTADEAFQTKSGKYFSDFMLETLRIPCCEPIMIGDLKGDATIGEDCLKNIVFEHDNTSKSEKLQIWITPDEPKGQITKRRFIVVVDIGGLHCR